MRPSSRFALGLILATVTLDAIGIGLIAPILPQLLDSLGQHQRLALHIGTLTALYALMQFLFAPALGALSDRFGRRPVLLFSLAGGLLPASTVGGAAQLVPNPALIAVAMGLVMQGSYLGQVIGPSLFGSVVQAAGWPAAAIPVALAALGAVAAAFALRRCFAVDAAHD